MARSLNNNGNCISEISSVGKGVSWVWGGGKALGTQQGRGTNQTKPHFRDGVVALEQHPNKQLLYPMKIPWLVQYPPLELLQLASKN